MSKRKGPEKAMPDRVGKAYIQRRAEMLSEKLGLDRTWVQERLRGVLDTQGAEAVLTDADNLIREVTVDLVERSADQVCAQVNVERARVVEYLYQAAIATALDKKKSNVHAAIISMTANVIAAPGNFRETPGEYFRAGTDSESAFHYDTGGGTIRSRRKGAPFS